jgi:hypothetical protein
MKLNLRKLNQYKKKYNQKEKTNDVYFTLHINKRGFVRVWFSYPHPWGQTADYLVGNYPLHMFLTEKENDNAK